MAQARGPSLRQNKLNTSPDSLIADWLRAPWASHLMPTSLVPIFTGDGRVYLHEWVQTLCPASKVSLLGSVSSQACSSELYNLFQEETEGIPGPMNRQR